MLKVAIVQEEACKNRQTQKITCLWKSELQINCKETRKGTAWTCLAPDGKGKTCTSATCYGAVCVGCRVPSGQQSAITSLFGAKLIGKRQQEACLKLRTTTKEREKEREKEKERERGRAGQES